MNTKATKDVQLNNIIKELSKGNFVKNFISLPKEYRLEILKKLPLKQQLKIIDYLVDIV